MSITIGGDTLHYKTDETKYITTYITEYNPAVDSYLNRIFDAIVPSYSSKHLMYSNTCGANAEFVCKTLNMDGIRPGKIIIIDWIRKNAENLAIIESVYGRIKMTIGATYHALVYLEINIDDKIYYIAIETTLCDPYKLQFYVGNNIDELRQILRIRYQCNDFKISHDCEKDWLAIAYDYSGGKTKKMKNKNEKTMKTWKRKVRRKGVRKGKSRRIKK